MPGWEMKIIEAEARRLIALAAEDAGLRSELRALAEMIRAATEDHPPGADPTEGSHDDPASSNPDAREAGADPDEESNEPEPLHELTLGRSRPASPERLPPSGEALSSASDAIPDLDEIEAHCLLKAEAARHAAARLRRLRGGAGAGGGLVSGDQEVAAWADRFADAYYWMETSDTS